VRLGAGEVGGGGFWCTSAGGGGCGEGGSGSDGLFLVSCGVRGGTMDCLSVGHVAGGCKTSQEGRCRLLAP
jgi:hypothetical protein